MEENKKMTGYRCKNCGRIGHIPGVRCIECEETEFEEIELGDKCKLVTFTEIHNPPSKVSSEGPLVIGLLKFPNDVKVIGQLIVKTSEELKSEEFTPVWGELREIGGKKAFGFKFKPIEKTSKSSIS